MNGHATSDSPQDQHGQLITSPLRRIKFKVKMPTVAIENPSHIVPLRKYTSFKQWFEEDKEEPGPGQDVLPEAEIKERATELVHVRTGFEEGGLLTDSSLRLHHLDPDAANDFDHQEEPAKQYSHYDHLVAHALHFRKLLDREHAHHVRVAKQVASEIVRGVAVAKSSRPKTEEELEEERRAAMRQIYRQVNADLKKQWSMVEEEVNKSRLAEWQKEQEALGKEHLNRVLEQHTQMLEARKLRESDDESLLEDDEDLDSIDRENKSSDIESDEDESNMSESSEEGEEDDKSEDVDNDAKLTVEELRQKYASVSETPKETPDLEYGESSMMDDMLADDQSGIVTNPDDPQELDESMMDDSDPSIEMDSDISQEDSDEDSEDGDSNSDSSAEASEDEDVAGGGLLGFFGASARKQILETAPLQESQSIDVVDSGLPETEDIASYHAAVEGQTVAAATGEPTDSPSETAIPFSTDEVNADLTQAAKVDGIAAVPSSREQDPDQVEVVRHVTESMDVDEVVNDSHASHGPSSQASPGTFATKESEAESFSSVDGQMRDSTELAESKQTATIKTPVPSLLRGNLREYQHFGLDWLAKLYANNTNGILADEMGLGKTIQSIALLAHLAEVHEAWGPHLIIVPTSVMLNWEMEFKKFLPGFKILTYYGSQEERKAKRRGWLDDDLWNVCITSYQLVLQDQVAFKRRNWHYMILDEAHNIKNFRSQRWQTLLGFKTRARLLLTGTPLQNNLTELWSLLFFLQPSDNAGEQDEGFAGLKDFSEWFRKPVDQILEHGRDIMDDEAREQVTKLHKVIRPFLLRRLKADVEKQMPAKYEHVELCRLSKRQRQLYDGFMSRAQTKETLASGNYLSIINCLMQLRKVCNHPDLFETRPITTSFAMSRSAVADFEIQDLFVRRKFLQQEDEKLNLGFLQLAPISREDRSTFELLDSSNFKANQQIQLLRDRQRSRIDWEALYDGTSTKKVLRSMDNSERLSRLTKLDGLLYGESFKHSARKIWGGSLMKKLSISLRHHKVNALSKNRAETLRTGNAKPVALQDLMLSVNERAFRMEPIIQKFACITPSVVAPNMPLITLTSEGAIVVQDAQKALPDNPFHEAQTRLSIAFPDKRLLQYDCGKLQRLDKLLRQLQSGGHRALIFTQMTKVLDILEQFLNIHGHRYLRLDGSTKLEQRQALTDRFNNDTRILAFILSSRSGGLGINLTGADTVIFYDLDWNPAMDKQCQDRAHRIGQTRDVHIYRFVSEHTIESNILRKSNQKRMLDDVVIQEGDFTTDYFNKVTYRDVLPDAGEEDDEANVAMDRVLGNSRGGIGSAFAQVEDTEDAAAAKAAEKEIQHVDAGDFDEKAQSATPKAGADTPHETASVFDGQDHGEDALGSIDDHMLKIQAYLLKDTPLPLPVNKNRKRSKKGQEHRIKRKR
ncbi:putative helicase swr1 [Phaeomoniella chlamydospora]|uniref:DNA helicase n=1 Tax=Phaeomoniella chlamydospora TaxID=158046 RepID=A0A0G2E936_PHACM|nr:putative helicase swr1 [Phaeomoniella chlamydospora]